MRSRLTHTHKLFLPKTSLSLFWEEQLQQRQPLWPNFKSLSPQAASNMTTTTTTDDDHYEVAADDKARQASKRPLACLALSLARSRIHCWFLTRFQPWKQERKKKLIFAAIKRNPILTWPSSFSLFCSLFLKWTRALSFSSENQFSPAFVLHLKPNTLCAACKARIKAC